MCPTILKCQSGKNDVAADDFAFKNASNAKQVTLKDIQDKVGDLPDNFKIGGSK